MLFTQNVDIKLLKLLDAIMRSSTFKAFNLVGGTSLALQIGHRISIDIDLFGISDINEIEFNKKLSSLGSLTILKKNKNILVYAINGVKVDFVNYPYPLLEKPNTTNSIRMASLKDIAAMKLNAISGRGSKKDFVDLYYLLKTFSLETMFQFYSEKYVDGSTFLALKSLSYFEDAEKEEMPIMTEKIDWQLIKHTVLNEAKRLA
jgi:predicted nucleotidyltransferase component of viral defense system